MGNWRARASVEPANEDYLLSGAMLGERLVFTRFVSGRDYHTSRLYKRKAR